MAIVMLEGAAVGIVYSMSLVAKRHGARTQGFIHALLDRIRDQLTSSSQS
jgi:hypothetical protein